MNITFHWDVVRRFPTVLPGFIAISLVFHAATFFIFRIVYPPQASMAAPPPAVMLLDQSRPDHQALLRWIEAEDPTPAMNAANAITERLLDVPYKPSYAALRTPPLTLAEEESRIQFPPARDPLAIIRSVEPPSSFRTPAPTGDPTGVVFTGDLQPRVSSPLPTFTVTKKSAKELEEAVFLVGVDARGAIQFVMPQSSSGSPAADEEAARYLGNLKLSPGDKTITWGRAKVKWGADAYTSP